MQEHLRERKREENNTHAEVEPGLGKQYEESSNIADSHWWSPPRLYNLTDTADMSGGTKLLRGHIWLLLIRACDPKQANVVNMLFFGKHLRNWLKCSLSKLWIWQNHQMCPLKHFDLNVPLKKRRNLFGMGRTFTTVMVLLGRLWKHIKEISSREVEGWRTILFPKQLIQRWGFLTEEACQAEIYGKGVNESLSVVTEKPQNICYE